MKRVILLSSLLLLCFGGEAFAGKPKVLVQDLVAQGVEAHEARVISTATCNSFAQSEKYDFLCGDDLRHMMQFGALAATFDKCVDDACYTSLGKAMQARFIISGTVSRLGKIFVLSLSMLDTKTGRSIGRTELKANSLESLHSQTDEAVSAVLTNR